FLNSVDEKARDVRDRDRVAPILERVHHCVRIDQRNRDDAWAWAGAAGHVPYFGTRTVGVWDPMCIRGLVVERIGILIVIVFAADRILRWTHCVPRIVIDLEFIADFVCDPDAAFDVLPVAGCALISACFLE